MADDNNQNNQKQKGGNNAPKMGLNCATSVTAVNNSNLGETIRGAVADGLGFTLGAIATGFASYIMNKIIKRVKPSATTLPVFPSPEDKAAQGPNARELMGQLHQLRNSNREEATRIVESVGKALGLSISTGTPAIEEQKQPAELTPAAEPAQPAQEPTEKAPKKELKKEKAADK